MAKAVFPGTFDPIHNGHIDIAMRASQFFDTLIVAVYDRPLKELLFSPEERLKLVRRTFDGKKNVEVKLFSGLIVEFCRAQGAGVIVRGLRVFSDFEHEFRMALANRRLAPEVDVVALITNEEHSFLTGSTLREIASLGGDVSSMVPKHVEKAMQERFGELGEQGIRMTSLRD
jgi:pantetheine-phosphate adenylyltransferase